MGLWGVVQPLADALKLFLKEKIIPHGRNQFLFIFAPRLRLVLALAVWHLYPSSFNFKYVSWGLLLFFCITALNVYGILLAGWSSNSKYAFLGALRAAAQTISYEVSLLLLILFPAFLLKTYHWEEALNIGFPIILVLFPLTLVWFVRTIAETNRAPFDFAEGESELVSGFNIEFGGGFFTLLFLAEYANILFIAVARRVWFLRINIILHPLTFSFTVFLVARMFLLVRGAYPRYRYDLLIRLCWKCYLPFALCALCLVSLVYGI